MPVERLDPSCIAIESTGDAEADRKAIQRFVERDHGIRSGLCPNGCGLMDRWAVLGAFTGQGQCCPTCGFTTNQPADKETRQ